MKTYLLIPFLPLAAFLINILLGRQFIRDKAHWVAVPAVFLSWVFSLMALADVAGGRIINEDLYTWFSSGTFRASVGFLIDQLTAVMLIVVTTVSTLVHIYSIGYMHGDKGYYRFFSFLSLFTFSMLMLVMANNLIQLYFGWEAVGLCSYFLIGYYYDKKSAADAGKKAFIVNRFGDFGFGLGVILIFLSLGTVNYAEAFASVNQLQGIGIDVLGFHFNLVTLIALLLFCGAVGKSAQLPLHVWLPDAMEGPTPVSALIHAATMVTAGVFMVARCSPIFNLSPVAMSVVAITGATTAFFAATIGLVQNDIKRIIAYSTVSQLGYMFLALGVGAYSAGIFHLYTHAFFKALLFLGAGSVMHAMGGELDIQKMGGLKKYMPITYWTFLLASISIAGIPGFAGFFSKDEILWQAYAAGPLGKTLFVIGALTALMTAFYSFRIIYLTFHGTFRGTHEQEHHLHESPLTMTIPLVILAIGAVAAGWVGIPHIFGGHNQYGEFMKPLLTEPAGHGSLGEEWGVVLLSVILASGGIYLAYHLYMKRRDLVPKIVERFGMLYHLFWNKWFVDELYHNTIVRPTLWVADAVIVKVTDGRVIEGIVNGVPRLIGQFAGLIRQFQTGLIHRYAVMMGFAFLVIVAITFIWY